MSQKIGACNLSIPMHQYSRKRSMDLRASNFLDTPKMWFADILLLHTSFETLWTKMRIGHAACFLNFALEVLWSPRILIIQWSLNRSKSSMTPSSSLTRTRTTGSPWRPVGLRILKSRCLFQVGSPTFAPQEFGTLLSSLGQNPTEQELQEWIGGDGEHDASRIDFHTFLSLMSRKLKETDSWTSSKRKGMTPNLDVLIAFYIFGTLDQPWFKWYIMLQRTIEKTH